MILGIHTVFILRENILFLEEWIDYHVAIGFNRFYLYDNSLSTETMWHNPVGTNKYHFNYTEITKFISDKQLDEMASKIYSKYPDMIKVIEWSPVNYENQVVYGQKDSIIHYINYYAKEVDWTAFIDVDEFIFCPETLKIQIQICERNFVGNITLYQKKFDDRFNNINTPVTEITDCIKNLDTSQWAPKIILKTSAFDDSYNGYWGIHYLPIKESFYIHNNPKMFRFNHYNINELQLEWMKIHYHSTKDFKLNSHCTELKDFFIQLKQSKTF